MEAVIIMTECTGWDGRKYVDFTEKVTGRRMAEVDRRIKELHGYTGYAVFAPRGGHFSQVARRTKKDSAIEFAKQAIRGQFPGADFKFVWNAMTYKYKFA